MVLAWPSEIHA